MKDVIRVKMGMEELKGGDIKLHFAMGVQKDVSSIMTKEELKRIDELSEEMTKVIAQAMERVMCEEEEVKEEESLSDMLDEKINNIYEKLNDEEKKEVDDFKEKVDKCSSFEELFDLIREII